MTDLMCPLLDNIVFINPQLCDDLLVIMNQGSTSSPFVLQSDSYL